MATNGYDDNVIQSMQFLEHLRAKPGMYGFQLNSINGLIQQIKEIVDNSVDEALDPSKTYPIDITFFVSKDKTNYQVLIQDHGRGIPVSKLRDCFCKEFTSGKYAGEYGGTSTGTFGVGSKGSAALAKMFIAFTKRDDGFAYLEVEKGVVKNHFETKKRIDKDSNTIGTTVLMQPDDTMFECIPEMFAKNVRNETYTGIELYQQKIEFYNVVKPNVDIHIRLVSGLLKPGDFSNHKDPADLWQYLTNLNNFKTEEIYHSDLGLTPRQYVINKFNLKEPIWELGELTKTSNDADDPLSYRIDLFMDERSLKGDNGYIGAVNATPIIHPDSSHIATTHDVIKGFLLENFANEEEKSFFEAKYRLPLSGCISVGWQGAEFIGQDKTRFENRQFVDCFRSYLRKALRKIAETKGEGFWDHLYELIRPHFEIEYAKFTRKTLRSSASIKNLCYALQRPGSFSNCRSTNNQITELFITEGDSAAGRVLTERDEVTQAMLKLSGKPINAIRASAEALRKNAVFQDLVTILGVSPADKNLDNMRFSRILLMTDADADGYHIVALMIGIFYKINPLILEEGRVYVTNPPLYSYVYKNKAIYLRDENALNDARVSAMRVLLDIDISFDAGKTRHNLNKNVAWFRDMYAVISYIGNIVSHEADLLNIEPLVLEQLIHCVDYLSENNVNVKKIIEILDLEDAIWDKDNNVLIIVDKGSLERRIPLSNLQTRIKSFILPEYKRFNWDKFYLFVTTKHSDLYVAEPCSFMMLYMIQQTLFQPEKGLMSVRRFKGLGEMDADAIRLTCVDKHTRCFTVIRGLGDLDAMYKMLDVDTDARKKLIKTGFIEEE